MNTEAATADWTQDSSIVGFCDESDKLIHKQIDRDAVNHCAVRWKALEIDQIALNRPIGNSLWILECDRIPLWTYQAAQMA
jgi:hypothetical protein